MFLKNPIIIIDGPDCTGKTTLAESFRSQFDCHYLHKTYRFKKNIGVYTWALLTKALRLSRSKPVIMDRLWLTEKCYAKVYRDGSKVSEIFRAMERFLFQLLNVIIILTPGDDSVSVDLRHQATMQERGELYNHGMGKVNKEYLKELTRLKKLYPENVFHYTLEEQGDNVQHYTYKMMMVACAKNLSLKGEYLYDLAGTDDGEF